MNDFLSSFVLQSGASDDFKSLIIDQNAIEELIKSIKIRMTALTPAEKANLIIELISLIDLTTLSGDDTPTVVSNLVDKALNPLSSDVVSKMNKHVSCAAVCVYPARIVDVVDHLKNLGHGTDEIGIASVAGGFPSGQYRLETRLQEVKFAIEDGATEIDVVINRSAALTGQWLTVFEEISQMKQICGQKTILKTILATGELKTLENVHTASLIAMAAGSDFIKTSTGKETINATLPSSWIMCRAIKQWHEKTGRQVGFKPAGGIKTTDDAMSYYFLVESVLGQSWLNSKLFRIGASSLLDALIKDLSTCL